MKLTSVFWLFLHPPLLLIDSIWFSFLQIFISIWFSVFFFLDGSCFPLSVLFFSSKVIFYYIFAGWISFMLFYFKIGYKTLNFFTWHYSVTIFKLLDFQLLFLAFLSLLYSMFQILNCFVRAGIENTAANGGWYWRTNDLLILPCYHTHSENFCFLLSFSLFFCDFYFHYSTTVR